MDDVSEELNNGVKELVRPDVDVCLPGQPVLLALPGAILALGGGIERRDKTSSSSSSALSSSFPAGSEVLVSSLCGVLRRENGPLPGSPATYLVQPSTQKRYIPRKGDPVVCTVVKATATFYSVSIGAAHPASLGVTAFDGATKPNRPRLKVGDVVYAHVEQCDAGLTVDVSCCAVGAVAAKDWSTGEALFGPLTGGTVVAVPLGYASDLFHGRVSVLSRIGEKCAYEACIGLNGRIWIRGSVAGGGHGGGAAGPLATEEAVTIAVAECLLELAADAGNEEAVRQRVETYFPGAA
jgi:exosome complex component RRP40